MTQPANLSDSRLAGLVSKAQQTGPVVVFFNKILCEYESINTKVIAHDNILLQMHENVFILLRENALK
jgi:hypothetical protein